MSAILMGYVIRIKKQTKHPQHHKQVRIQNYLKRECHDKRLNFSGIWDWVVARIFASDQDENMDNRRKVRVDNRKIQP